MSWTKTDLNHDDRREGDAGPAETIAANNHANVSSTGFRAELNRLRAVPVQTQSFPTRAVVIDSTIGSDFTTGPVQQIGRSLEIAIYGQI